ncbi:MAG: hypothetical protein RLZZ63_817 [Gemmatimonadota bacterium]
MTHVAATEPVVADSRDQEALALEGITVRFGSVTALDGAHCSIRRGTVHAILGENGAGKTTLMRTAFGWLAPDAGTIRVQGAPTTFRSSAEAIAQGIGMVHQHFMLIPAMTVTENIALGGRGPFDAAMTAARITAVATQAGLPVDPTARVRDLAVSAQQRVEIVKALVREARILILDEPTAVLTPDQATELLRWARTFADAGGTVVLITHKLREAFAVADDLTVLRQGRTVLSAARAMVTEAHVIEALTGAGVVPGGAGGPVSYQTMITARGADPHDVGHHAPVLRLDGVHYVDPRGVTRLHAVDLTVYPGEILGVIGVEGSGPRELLRILAGRLAPTTGRVIRPDVVGFVPEDRLHDAVIPSFSLTENLVLAESGEAHGWMDWSTWRTVTRDLLATADVRAAGPDVPMATLSGGNQQRFVVGREWRRATAALIVEHPTRGLDLTASARILADLRTLGGHSRPAVVFHSADLDEVLAVATRVVACFEGRVREVSPPSDPTDRTPYTRAMTGMVETIVASAGGR